jgi:phosphoserine aminotransferase
MKKYNFNAGPSILPQEVIKQTAEAVIDFQGEGLSILEISHRAKYFQPVVDEAEALMKELLGIPEGYRVIFVGGGASLQFCMVPFNCLEHKAAYLNTGVWSKKAIKEAKAFGEVVEVATSAADNFTHIPMDFEVPQDADYLHITTNNTIYGTEISDEKLQAIYEKKGNVPLIADMSSDILARPIDVSKYDIIYGGAQKNVAPAGLTICIIREDMLGNARDITPTMLNYQIHADNDSLYNTPPCYTIYICKLVLEWLKEMGGLEAIKERNVKKAKILYDFLDNSKMFKGTVVPEDRSLMNVPFVTDSEELNAKFIKEATEAGFVNLKGHRTVGGMRASIYNAMPIEGVKALVAFMEKFEKENA